MNSGTAYSIVMLLREKGFLSFAEQMVSKFGHVDISPLNEMEKESVLHKNINVS